MILDKSRNASPRLARGRSGALIAGALLLAAIATQVAPKVAFATASSDQSSSLPPVGSERKVKDPQSTTSPAPTVEAEIQPPPAPGPSEVAVPVHNPQSMVKPAGHPIPVHAPHSGDDRASLEQRIAELERLVEAMVDQQHVDLEVDLDAEPRSNPRQERSAPFIWKTDPSDGYAFAFKFEEEAVERAMEEAEKAMEKGMEAYEKAMEDLGETWEKHHGFDHQKDFQNMHRESLEQQRKNLGRQLEKLEQQRRHLQEQIDGLEDQLDHLQEQAEAE